ncbi:Cu/Pi carrier [Puccinia graminis f. sp. tritici]|uniref:Cu/Pi carrier n=1 Tax=Puccinia graminis f. sp. tritici TaxID=56615 RepID=A0A5B0RNN0_PUCGR|nr:Cu/Pi carrier [Puccinia graminis f. sp. tritici]
MQSILLPHLVSPFNLKSTLGDSNALLHPWKAAGILDDSKSKAKQIEEGIDRRSKASIVSSSGIGAGSTASPQLHSTRYYTACISAGVAACGLTHALVTPLDLVKCRRQVDKTLYRGNLDGWIKIYKAGGVAGLYTGVGPTWLGYSVQGGCKYGFYEYFKKKYADAVGPTNAVKYKDGIYLASSATAELIADAAYVPLEAVKVRMQTTIPPFAAGTVDGFQKFVAVEGVQGLYKSLGSLWSRQIPYTMMKFWSFEATVRRIYASLGKPKESYNKVRCFPAFLSPLILSATHDSTFSPSLYPMSAFNSSFNNWGFLLLVATLRGFSVQLCPSKWPNSR